MCLYFHRRTIFESINVQVYIPRVAVTVKSRGSNMVLNQLQAKILDTLDELILYWQYLTATAPDATGFAISRMNETALREQRKHMIKNFLDDAETVPLPRAQPAETASSSPNGKSSSLDAKPIRQLRRVDWTVRRRAKEAKAAKWKRK